MANEPHVALGRARWDANRDQWYIDCMCGDRIWGDTIFEASDEYSVHLDDAA